MRLLGEIVCFIIGHTTKSMHRSQKDSSSLRLTLWLFFSLEEDDSFVGRKKVLNGPFLHRIAVSADAFMYAYYTDMRTCAQGVSEMGQRSDVRLEPFFDCSAHPHAEYSRHSLTCLMQLGKANKVDKESS